jgi:hypothetical protein
MYHYVRVQSDSWFCHQEAKTENTKSAITPELMAGSSPNFYHIYILLKVTEVNVKDGTVGTFHYYLS